MDACQWFRCWFVPHCGSDRPLLTVACRPLIARDVSGPEETWDSAEDRPQLITASTLEQWKSELRTDRLDWVCVHELGEDRVYDNREQQELCATWLQQEKISRLGIWNPGADAAEKYGHNTPYSFMIRPFNIANSDSSAFYSCHELGWDCYTCSPFVRGWDLDKLVDAGGDCSDCMSVARVADHMLRFSLHQPFSSGLVSASRRVEWLDANLESVKRGPLSPEQWQWLCSLAVAAGLVEMPATGRAAAL